jgi:hypothetical protein
MNEGNYIPYILETSQHKGILIDINLTNVLSVRSGEIYEYTKRVHKAAQKCIKWKRDKFKFKGSTVMFHECDMKKIKEIATKHNIDSDKLYNILKGI